MSDERDAVDPKFVNIDPLEPTYRESIVENPERFRPETWRRSALLCIDMQYLDAARGFGVFADVESEPTIPNESQDYYFDRLERIVFPNVRRLQDAFRERGLEVIHVRIQSLTIDGRDRSPSHKRLKLLAAPGSKEADFIEQVAPQGDEIVMNKTASGVFTASNLELVLHNLEIDSLYFTGVYTDECVSTAIRDASDLGFFTTLVEDCCATVTEDRHLFTVETLRDRYARVVNAATVLQELDESGAERLEPA